MKVDKLYAVIEKRVPEKKSSINKVIGIKYFDHELITDTEKILSIFPEGRVFTPRCFEGKNEELLQEKDLVEIPIEEIYPLDFGKSIIRVDHGQIVKKHASRIIEIPDSLVTNSSIDLNTVNVFFEKKGVISPKSGEFYLSVIDDLYGPFKVHNLKIEPKLGKEVNQYKFLESNSMSYDHEMLLLDKPSNEISKIDCMTSTQLLDWLKERIKVYGDYSVDVNKIINLLKRTNNDLQISNDLDKIRFERSVSYLENLEFSYEELENLKKDNNTWSQIFQKAYEINKAAFEKEHLTNLKQDLENVNVGHIKEIEELNKTKQKLADQIEIEKKEFTRLTADVNSVNKELVLIENKREEILLNLKLQSGFQNNLVHTSINNSTVLQAFEVQENLKNNKDCFTSLDAYLDELKSNIKISNQDKTLFEYGLSLLSRKKFLLSNNINYVLTLIKSLGNTSVCIQQAEPDWIKFEKMFSCGLKQSIDSAELKRELKHFYILEDFNLPSVECYGKPILDIADKIRMYIPGTNRLWPENLYIVFITFELKSEGFGFDINRSTFTNWGIFPNSNSFKMCHQFELPLCVNFDIIKQELNEDYNGDILEYLD